MKSLKQLAQDALDVQDACNLSGVVHGFSRFMTELNEALPNLGTDRRNNHPLVRLWVDKLAHLSGLQTLTGVAGDRAAEAMQWAMIAAADGVPVEA